MRVYRLGKAAYHDTASSGQGGFVSDGRWHSLGRPIVYTATSEALAVLEVRVHLSRPVANVLFAIHVTDVPDDAIETLAAASLPADWNSVPPRTASQLVGDAWLASGRSLALLVPSIHSESDATLLLNPRHPGAARVRRLDSRPYPFAPRHFT